MWSFAFLLQAKIESLQEMLEVLRDDELMEAIRRGVQEIAENKGNPWMKY